MRSRAAERWVFLAIGLIAASLIYRAVRYPSLDVPVWLPIPVGAVVGALLAESWIRVGKLPPPITPLRTRLAVMPMTVILALGVFLLVTSIRTWESARAERNWPSATATILDSEVFEAAPTRYRSPEGRFAAIWSYEFRVGERIVRSRSTSRPYGYRLAFFPTREGALADGQRRPKGSTILVYYNPERPEESVIDRPGEGSGSFVALGSLGVIVSGIAITGLAFVRRRIRSI